MTNTTTCDAAHTEYRTSVLSSSSAGVQTSTVVSAVVSSICVVILVLLFIVFIYLYGKYNEESTVGRQLKSLQQSYQQFGDKTSKLRSITTMLLPPVCRDTEDVTGDSSSGSSEILQNHVN